jgi:serine/threonine protein kinase/WD40 repeat protein
MAGSSNRQKELFLAARDLPSTDEQAAFLAEACGPDEALRRQVEAMLKAHAVPDSFLEKPAAAMALTVAADGNADVLRTQGEDPGTQVGPYKLLEKIGEGGMGVVYMAQQHEPIRRMVALKIIKPGMDSGQVLARFEAERQALALMDHPNIARVLDAGATAEGRPFFVMELVKGTPITTFCDERRLSARQRLELFVSVCQAIQHAHQKGIIHRDIKPSNVLVALYDDKPVPKVIDFGVAKAAGQPLTERTLNTGFGAIVGTPEYMSPEQATFNQLDIDTRSDVYSLGVLLYELLTGTTPVDRASLKENALLEVLRVVREQEPPRPSLRLSTSQARASIAATRGIAPDQLAQLLRGELDWIVMKSLEKERNRRYETAAGLARDVDRYLRDELVEARPPSLAYRLRKTIRRNRGLVIAASMVLLALVGGVIGTTIGMLRAIDAEDRALSAEGDARAQERIARGEAEDAKKARDDKARLAGLEEAARKRAEKNELDAKFQTLRADTSRHAIQMEAILQAWQRDDLITAYAILDKVPEAKRQTWEYRYVRDLCRRRAIPILEDKTIKLVGRPVLFTSATLDDYVTLSPDGKTIAVDAAKDTKPYSEERLMVVIDAATGKERFRVALTGYPRPLFSSDSKLLVFTHQPSERVKNKRPGLINILDAATGTKRTSVEVDFAEAHFGVLQLALSPDGKLLACGCPSVGAVVLDTASGAERFRIDEPKCAFAGGLAIGDDGKLALVCKDGLKIYERGVLKRTIPANFYNLAAVNKLVALSPDSKYVLTCVYLKNEFKGGVKVWDTASGAEKRDVGIGQPILDLGFTADGHGIVTVHDRQPPHGSRTKLCEVKVFDLESGKEKPAKEALGPTCRAMLGEGGKWLQDRQRNLKWPLKRPELATATLDMDSTWRNASLAFMSDDEYCKATSVNPGDEGRENWLMFWDLRTGKVARSLVLHSSDKVTLDPVLFSEDGKRVLWMDFNKRVARYFDTVSGAELGQLLLPPKAKGNQPKIELTGDWKRIATYDTDKGIFKVFEAATEKELFHFPFAPASKVVVSPERRFYLVQGTQPGELAVLDAGTAKVVTTIKVPGENIVASKVTLPKITDGTLSTITDGISSTSMFPTRFAVNNSRGNIIWLDEGKTILTYGPQSGSKHWEVQVWDVQTGREQARFPMPAPKGHVDFGAAGRKVLMRVDGEIRPEASEVRDMDTGQAIVMEDGPSAGHQIVFSPDGTRLFSGNRVWDLATGQVVFTFPAEADVHAWGITRDSRRMLATYGKADPASHGVFAAP